MFMRQNSLSFFALIVLFACCFFSCTKSDLKDVGPSSDKSGNAGIVKPGNNKLNIILIVADDIGYEVPTVNGGQSYLTPTIDRMAKNGVRFTQCHSLALCSPSRTTLLTGKYNFRNYTTWGSLATTEKTFANMLADAGYKTCVSGKWQFNGGAASIKSFGFQNYCVWDAFKESDEETDAGSQYKNPKVYQDGAYLPDSATNGKYGEDIFCSYVKDFINNNKKSPFFIYYPMILCHAPYSPTPDDPEFASWNPDKDKSDTSYFPSMVKYMDKKISEVINTLTTNGLANNTLILFTGDNGTPQQIYSLYNGVLIQGGKSHTTDWGTHVPLIAYCPSKVSKAIVKDLVCFPDFLPTLAGVAKISKPSTYGILDGISFYNQIFGLAATPREWMYSYYNPHPDENPLNTLEYVQDTTYKLYNGKQTGFYNIFKDSYEKKPIASNKLTTGEKRTKTEFQSIIDSIGATK